MSLYVLLKLAHVAGACVLLGTGIGIAFFMWMANRTGEAGTIAATARVVVIADTVFTAAAVVAILKPSITARKSGCMSRFQCDKGFIDFEGRSAPPFLASPRFTG